MPASSSHPNGGPPAETPAERRAGRLVRLAQAANLCGRELRRAIQGRTRELGLGDADLLVLWSCAGGADRGVAQNQLVEEIGLSPAQTSGLLDRLRQRGLVASRRPAQDRRRQLWRLEPDGRQLLSEALTRIVPLAESALLPLSSDEQTTLENLLTAVAGAARGGTPPEEGTAPRPADATSHVAGEAA